MAWLIIRHSFELLFRNLGNALKVSVGPVLLVAIFSTLVILTLGMSADDLMLTLANGAVGGAFVLAFLMVLVAILFASAWIAVAWHRFILLEEYPGLLPAIAERPIVTYAIRSILLGLLMILALIPAVIVIGIIAQILGPESPLVIAAFGFAIGVYFSYFWLRLAIILPATAVGKSMRLTEAWAATAGLSGPILGASAILVALNVGITGIVGALSGGVISIIIEIAVNWVTLMIGTSILTTIYGNAVEGRPLG
jgi:hypothetical protein